MEIKELLEKVKNGEMELSRAEEILKELPYENLGYANLDHHRQLRNGYGETIYCESKTAEQIEGILHSFQKRGSNVMGTRVKPEQYIYLKERFPELIYHPEARVIMLMDHPVEQVGMVAVCTAGTSDIPVAEEAARHTSRTTAKIQHQPVRNAVFLQNTGHILCPFFIRHIVHEGIINIGEAFIASMNRIIHISSPGYIFSEKPAADPFLHPYRS